MARGRVGGWGGGSSDWDVQHRWEAFNGPDGIMLLITLGREVRRGMLVLRWGEAHPAMAMASRRESHQVKIRWFTVESLLRCDMGT